MDDDIPRIIVQRCPMCGGGFETTFKVCPSCGEALESGCDDEDETEDSPWDRRLAIFTAIIAMLPLEIAFFSMLWTIRQGMFLRDLGSLLVASSLYVPFVSGPAAAIAVGHYVFRIRKRRRRKRWSSWRVYWVWQSLSLLFWFGSLVVFVVLLILELQNSTYRW